jgi:hypothetical protein
MKRSIRLDDDIPYNEQISSYEFRRRLSEVNYHDLQHKENMYRNLDEETMNPVLKMTLDPYFSHFILVHHLLFRPPSQSKSRKTAKNC